MQLSIVSGHQMEGQRLCKTIRYEIADNDIDDEFHHCPTLLLFAMEREIAVKEVADDTPHDIVGCRREPVAATCEVEKEEHHRHADNRIDDADNAEADECVVFQIHFLF